MRSLSGCLVGCLTKLFVWSVAAVAFVWALTVLLHPWALHIGGRSTPFLYWHGAGTVVSKDGKTYPLYVTFTPWMPGGRRGGSAGYGARREGKIRQAHLTGRGWLCISPGNMERMQLSGNMYGGYTNSSDGLFDFRLVEWRKPFSVNPPKRGFFDVAGSWHGPDLVMDRPGEQGIQLNSGPFIDKATVTLRYASYEEFERLCRSAGGQDPHDASSR